MWLVNTVSSLDTHNAALGVLGTVSVWSGLVWSGSDSVGHEAVRQSATATWSHIREECQSFEAKHVSQLKTERFVPQR